MDCYNGSKYPYSLGKDEITIDYPIPLWIPYEYNPINENGLW
jgi:hypothetical protein